MTYMNFVECVAAKLEIPVRRTDKYIRAFAEEITNALKEGEDVRIPDFGTFKKAEAPERKAYTPGAGEITIPAHGKAKFYPSKSLKELMK